MSDIREMLDLLESKNKNPIKQAKLPYSRSGLSPHMSSALLDLHYGKLYKGYVDRYNNNEGDKSFNEAGAYLHELFFTQFKHPSGTMRPTGRILDLINQHFDNYVDFKEAVKVEAMKLQGSGWLYLARNGQLKVIRNHHKKTDIVLLIDLWEHAYQNDYHSNKGKYIDNLWKIINWDVLNHRL